MNSFDTKISLWAKCICRVLEQKRVEFKMLFGIEQVDMRQFSTEAGFSSVNLLVRGNRGIMGRACLYRV